MGVKYVIDDETMTQIADPLRNLTGRTDELTPAEMAAAGVEANAEVQTQADLIAQISAALEGKAGNGGGIVPTGTKQINTNGTHDVTAYAYAEVNVPTGGASPVLQTKSVTPTTSQQTVTPDSGYDGLSKVTVNAMPTATQATPSITVSSSGRITATATQTAGYVAAGTKTATKQLTTKGATTITPSSTVQTAVSAGTYVTGDIKVAAVSGGGGDSGDLSDLQYCWLNNYYSNLNAAAKVPPNAMIYFKSGWTWADFVASSFNLCMPDPGDGTGVGSPNAQPIVMLIDNDGCIEATRDFAGGWGRGCVVWSDYDNVAWAEPTETIIPGRAYYVT